METGKTSKYFQYAFGEIILVVIGILIALSINNWNEERKQANTLYTIYSIIKQDLNNDIQEIDELLKNYEEIRKPIFETLIHNQTTLDDWNKNPELGKVFRGYKDIAINQRGFDLFKNQSNISIVLEQDLATEITKFYNRHIVEIQVAQDELGYEFRDNNYHFKHSALGTAFYLDTVTDQIREYVNNNPDAKVRIASYYLYYKIYMGELKSFRTEAETLIQGIDLDLLERSK